MKKLLLIISFLATQLFAVQCTEQQYSSFFADTKEIRYMLSYNKVEDNSKNVIDKKSIVYDKENQKIKSWVISQMIGTPKYGIIQAYFEFNLKNNTNRILTLKGYDCEGRVLINTSEEGVWEDIPPESGYEKTLDSLKKYLNIKQ